VVILGAQFAESNPLLTDEAMEVEWQRRARIAKRKMVTGSTEK
jgi:hypothetical protein